MEEWKNIEGYEGRYQISNKGNIRSLLDNKGNERIVTRKPRIGKQGYYYLNLFKNGKSKSKKIHRLVAEAFILNPDNKEQVNHIDGNKLNNDVSNLEWCTCSENIKHALKIGLKVMPQGKNNYMYNRHGKDNPHSMAVIQYDLNSNKIKEWVNIKEAQETLNISHISDCCLGKRKTAGGYIWKVK